MSEPDRGPAAGGGSAEALILACVLAVTMLTAHAAWIGLGLYRPDRETCSDGPGATWSFMVVVFGVLALDGIAAVALGLRLTGSSRAPARRWVFGPGLLASLISIVTAALVLHSHVGKNLLDLYVPGAGPGASAALVLLALGMCGLLAALIGLLVLRSGGVLRQEKQGLAALAIITSAAMLLASLDAAYLAFISRMADYPSNDLLRAASAWFIVLAALSIPVAVRAVWWRGGEHGLPDPRLPRSPPDGRRPPFPGRPELLSPAPAGTDRADPRRHRTPRAVHGLDGGSGDVRGVSQLV
jgi:hypothetical protein